MLFRKLKRLTGEKLEKAKLKRAAQQALLRGADGKDGRDGVNGSNRS